MKAFREVLEEVQELAQEVHNDKVTPVNRQSVNDWLETIVTVQGEGENEQN